MRRSTDDHRFTGDAVFGAVCADANRPASSSYDPSAKLREALRNLEPVAAGVMSVQYEAGMSSSVTLSDGVAALCEAWASGATWDQARSFWVLHWFPYDRVRDVHADP